MPCAVFGASGYSGVELVLLLHNHPHFSLEYAFSSSAREDAEPIASLYPQLAGQLDVILQPWHSDLLSQLAQQVRVVFLALPHEASAAIAPALINAGLVVFDLSGAFRLRDSSAHFQAYGFARPDDLPTEIPYGLAEWTTLIGTEQLIAVPGCYPTVSSLALKPVMSLIDGVPMVNAVSGVSGAGRKAASHTSFCEVSLAAYGVATHRHQPEIAQAIGRDVIFVPHLGNFKRGILATIYAPLRSGVSQAAVDKAYQQAYAAEPLVRLCQQPPAIKNVVGTAFCDIHAVVHQNHLIICAAIDNLLKGAAAQAVQLANQYFDFAPALGLQQRGGVV
ncbi:N-acetyl-gamma-glutamyl-phosphate reductase [Pseudidiomarina tainanensis]|uniref:N-acetyl-gamma-glutamyl-phosphate reductase n=1 Tax=Pseudidiomarina tainanensis TaxID=502365 RepID=A0ACD2HHL6_9GAMM|nr:N-acetyl-gamma-glutamyl-phosphate reductase [Pseudidiomarina tainanensis]RZQ55732.1 N-acetyl-gamma-glutamyl-phosphate reductase [Pseudidiomarina tainanensis]